MIHSAPAQQDTTIRTETRVVLVDAVVTAKNGTYIRDLAPKDFRIWEDNKEQTIKSFVLESSTDAASQPRSLVLFFDESSMEASDQIPALQSASRFIDAETGPNRSMAVVSYDGVLRVRHNFTANAGRLKDALPAPASRVIEAGQQPQTTEPMSGRTIVDRGSIDDTGSRNMLQSLRYLGASLGVLPGRKIVVVFAGRIPPPLRRNPISRKPSMRAINLASPSIPSTSGRYPWPRSTLRVRLSTTIRWGGS